MPANGPTLGNGKICYVEIPALDVTASATFYQNVFGWKIHIRGNGTTAFDDGINEVSGTWVSSRKAISEPGLLVSIMVDNVAETVDKIKANGCKIIKQAEIGPDQYIAWFSDPGGNTLGIYQHPGGGHGKICYIEIPADDISRSAEFYQAILPWSIRNDDEGNAAFDDSVGVVSGMWEQGLNPATEVGILVYIMMDSVAETIEKIKSAGGTIIQPIGADAPEITARFSDPFGNILGLYQNPV